jgi:alpha-N-acetylglucosaminidase
VSAGGNASDGGQAVRGLLERTFGERAGEFLVEGLDLSAGPHAFEVDHDGTHVMLRGSSGVAQASALRWYLRAACRVAVTWDNPHPVLPKKLPGISTRQVAKLRHFYYLQPCTFSYTTVFWDWERWQQEIDWMALHGVDLPLSMTGQESVWQRTFRRVGVSDDEILRFLGGPAYLPFMFMSCVSDWAGPLPQSWIDEHVALATRVLARQREFGMTPVLGAFGGQVPASLLSSRASPARKLHWAEWGTVSLDPKSDLFAELSKSFIEEQAALFGTDHLYATDPFIEAPPPVESEEELALLSSTIYSGMNEGDPEAVWVMQSWPFTWLKEYWTPSRVRAFLDAIPDDRMLVLDLWAEHESSLSRLRQARPKPWLWCMLHNFGGRPGMYGKLSRIALASETAATDNGAVGVGATMEAILLDPVVYELLADVVWGSPVDDLDRWIDTWAATRCSGSDPATVTAAQRAWRLLAAAVYDDLKNPAAPASVVICRPTVAGDFAVTAPGLRSPSSEVPEVLLEPWRALYDAVQNVPEGAPLERDFVDVSAEILSRRFHQLQRLASGSFAAGDVKRFDDSSSSMLELLNGLDQLLGVRSEYLLSSWTGRARSWARSAEEAEVYESNARRLVTLWGNGHSRLHDYSGRHWAGLVATFYLPRWQRWVDYLHGCLVTNRDPDEESFSGALIEWEERWCSAPHDEEGAASASAGKAVAIASSLVDTFVANTARG